VAAAPVVVAAASAAMVAAVAAVVAAAAAVAAVAVAAVAVAAVAAAAVAAVAAVAVAVASGLRQLVRANVRPAGSCCTAAATPGERSGSALRAGKHACAACPCVVAFSCQGLDVRSLAQGYTEYPSTNEGEILWNRGKCPQNCASTDRSTGHLSTCDRISPYIHRRKQMRAHFLGRKATLQTLLGNRSFHGERCANASSGDG
jgi:hypothetical protein